MPPRWWAIFVALVFATTAIIRPRILSPFNKAWLAVGRLLHKMVTPIIMYAIFFLCITPTGWIMRRRGKDLLSLARRSDLSSYWVTRPPEQSATETMRRQF
jgi:hypothetical protein